ncbi:MAG: pyridoxal phosphate-dependent aminotransferase [Nitrospinota bacterium]
MVRGRIAYLWASDYFTSDRAIKAKVQHHADLYAKAKKMKKDGAPVINMAGASLNVPPEHAMKAMIDSLQAGGAPNEDYRGSPGLREAIAEREKEARGIEIDPEKNVLVVGGGTMQCLYLILHAIVNAGDEIIVFCPSLSLDEIVKLAGGKPVYVNYVPDDDGFAPDLDEVERSIGPRTKAIVLNTPHNPTGHVWTEDELKSVGDMALRHNILILTDEVWEELVYDGRKHISISSMPGMQDIAIKSSGATKSLSMFDYRVGWIIGNEHLIQSAYRLMFWLAQFCPPITQVAAEEILRGPKDWLEEQRQRHQKKRDILVDGLNEIPGFRAYRPEGSVAAAVDTSEVDPSSLWLSEYLLEKAQVLFAPGIAYLGEGYMRVSFRDPLTEEDIQTAVRRVREAIATRP